MEQYNVKGMSCAACSARVEKAVLKVPGVTSCSVSLLTNSMGVEGSVNPKLIIKAVEDAGYGASPKGKDRVASPESEDVLRDRETPLIKKRLIASIVLLLPLMYFSMGHMMWNWKVPEVLEGNHVALGLIQLLFTTAIMVINQKFFISGFKSLFRGAPNMDTLVALGSAASYVYSVFALFLMTDAQMNMDMEKSMEYMHEFYFESAAMILTLITIGKMLESHSKGKTTNALSGLMKLAPKTAVLRRDGEEVTVSVEEVMIGDSFVVRPGEQIPVDGIVIEGSSAVNESALTGESIPVDKEPGHKVSTGTMNESGYLVCEAVRVGEDTTLSQMIKLVSDAAATKAPIAKVADKVSGVFVPVVIGIALLTFGIWLLTGQTVGYSLARGISVLVISCPCALGLATPVAIMVGNGVGAKHGILFKTAQSLEETGKVLIAALDKTGTITNGKPRVTDLAAVDNEAEMLKIAVSLEGKSEHPLAKAVVEIGRERNVLPYEISDFKAVPGNGLTGRIDNVEVAGGNLDFIRKRADIPAELLKQAEALAEEGKTPLFFSRDKRLMGFIAVSDVIREDAVSAIRELREMGVHVIMLTGDNKKTARAIGRQAGVDEVVAQVLPEEKEEVIKKLKKIGRTAMVGDGINDALALTTADIGIAIGAGTDIAIDAADVVLMNSRLSDVPAAIRLSRKSLKNIHENLFWAFIYNIIGIPLAAGVWIRLFGWTLNPMFGAAAMSLSSFCVVSNALRLNLFNPGNSSKDKKRKDYLGEAPLLKEKEDKKMLMKINGMMCGHCEARVKSVLEALSGVESADVSHEEGTAKLTLSQDVDKEVLRKAVEEQGYEVVMIE